MRLVIKSYWLSQLAVHIRSSIKTLWYGPDASCFCSTADDAESKSSVESRREVTYRSTPPAVGLTVRPHVLPGSFSARNFK